MVQRCPPTENKGRRHTSTVSVAILPLLEKSFKPLPQDELKIITQGGSGPGGQNRNRRATAVRATHIPTSIMVFINNGRNQQQNKKEAIRILTSRVNQLYENDKLNRQNYIRRSQMGGGNRSGKVRTYDFIKSMVVDHRLGTKAFNIRKVMKGDFGLILD